jgi:hypothetical protein
MYSEKNSLQLKAFVQRKEKGMFTWMMWSRFSFTQLNKVTEKWWNHFSVTTVWVAPICRV